MNLKWKTCFKAGISIFLLYLCIHFLPMVQGLFATCLSALYPLIIGAIIAYIINIPMKFYEKHYFPKAKNKFAVKSRRPVCMTLAILSVIIIIGIIISLIVPQLIECVKLIVEELEIGFKDRYLLDALKNADTDEVKQAFDDLYQAMTGKTLKEKDEVIYATCRLCSLHQQTGFIDGIRLGLRLSQELNTPN